jgi:uncharacterized DUF497 family protein
MFCNYESVVACGEVADVLIFEWDDAKDRANRRKHGVSFELATRVFSDPGAWFLPDPLERGEERWRAIGRAGEHTVLVVAYIVRLSREEELVRIISARYALKHERHRYESETN